MNRYIVGFIVLAIVAAVCFGCAVNADAKLSDKPISVHSCATAPIPQGAPWNYCPDGYINVSPGSVTHIPDAATEFDLWDVGGTRHLVQSLAADLPDCLQYAFTYQSWYAGLDICNRDLYGFGKHNIRAYYWEG